MRKLSVSDREKFNLIRPQIKKRLKDFSKIPKDCWLREVALCLLTPQSSPVSAEAAIAKLTELKFFEKKIPPAKIVSILRNPPGGGYVRFHKTKAERLIKFLSIKDQVLELLTGPHKDIFERNTLRDMVLGFGLKEASHALRNIGRKNLAILDRHILRCLEGYGVVNNDYKTLNDKKYFAIEEQFLKFAQYNSVSIDELDLFFWWKATGFIYK